MSDQPPSQPPPQLPLQLPPQETPNSGPCFIVYRPGLSSGPVMALSPLVVPGQIPINLPMISNQQLINIIPDGIQNPTHQFQVIRMPTAGVTTQTGTDFQPALGKPAAPGQPEEVFVSGPAIDEFKEEPEDIPEESEAYDTGDEAMDRSSENENGDNGNEYVTGNMEDDGSGHDVDDLLEPVVKKKVRGPYKKKEKKKQVKEVSAKKSFIYYFKGLQPDFEQLNEERKNLFMTSLEQLLDEQ